ncbi:hypothetical protein Q3A66_15780 [Hymenobacter sp. BT770]|uniref:hypothetical protein n=1 Tax=Hymenobacter sp. BT770 TaxID=2886942 RepID=UPI001D115D11|nr:hypothetical protein [Hymenobacter sp. BT770]MCC3154756.1 hypothetical protein [Hymenobacter sp. BT770]MDO3416529.1 hypothetical protein [Hymenobacter sp. BT770]
MIHSHDPAMAQRPLSAPAPTTAGDGPQPMDHNKMDHSQMDHGKMDHSPAGGHDAAPKPVGNCGALSWRAPRRRYA